MFDPFEALEPGAPEIHDELPGVGGNVSMRWDFEDGDVDGAAARAAVIVEGRYSTPQAAPAPIETHAVIASFDPNGHLTVWSPVHMVFMYRKELADCLGLDWQRITVVQPPVGGSFGGKIDIDPHDFIAVMLARATRRPVKLVMSREEEFHRHTDAPAARRGPLFSSSFEGEVDRDRTVASVGGGHHATIRLHDQHLTGEPFV